MDELRRKLEDKFPCRKEITRIISQLIGVEPEETYPSAIYFYGHSGTGKTCLIKELLNWCGKQYQHFRYVHLNCVECYTTKILIQNILEELIVPPDGSFRNSDNMKDFVTQLCTYSTENGYIIAIDNAERLRDMEANVLPIMLRLQELTGLNICVVLISQLPLEKYYCKSGLSEIVVLHCNQYTKNETLRILGADLERVKCWLQAQQRQKQQDSTELQRKLLLITDIKTEFYNNYLNLFLSVFFKACRDLPELKINSRSCFEVYLEPVLKGSIEATDVTRLWRNIAGTLRTTLAQVYMRFDQTQDMSTIKNNKSDTGTAISLQDSGVRKLAKSLELPYYGKYLLIAAFLASYNSAKQDKRLFVKNHGKQRKRLQTVNAQSKVVEKLSTSLGPKSFTIDRLLAIFYAILEEKVGLTCNLLSQISTLVHLKLLSFMSGESNIMDGSARLQCTVGLEFVLYIGKVVDFNVRQYLCDFMQ